MKASSSLLSRLNGWALSLLLHVGVALLAGLSVFSVHLSGGSGRGDGGVAGARTAGEVYGATLRNSDEPMINGTVLPDVAQFGRLTPEDAVLEPVTEELPTPTVPFDVFAVGSSDNSATSTPPVVNESSIPRPGGAEGRSVKLPAASGSSGEGEGSLGQGGSGGGDSTGNGSGEGSGEGHATGVYTPSPAYPYEARRRNIEGSVLVEFTIAADGTCAVRRILESSGNSALDEAVESTVKNWKYRPADADGRPSSVTKEKRFTFRLVR